MLFHVPWSWVFHVVNIFKTLFHLHFVASTRSGWFFVMPHCPGFLVEMLIYNDRTVLSILKHRRSLFWILMRHGCSIWQALELEILGSSGIVRIKILLLDRISYLVQVIITLLLMIISVSRFVFHKQALCLLRIFRLKMMSFSCIIGMLVTS